MKKPPVYLKTAQKFIDQKTGEVKIKLSFPFDRDLISKIKTLPRAYFNAKDGKKYWICAFSEEIIPLLKEWGFMLSPDLFIDPLPGIKKREPAPLLTIPDLRWKLYPFQLEGVSIIESLNGNVLLADEMGLGKTVQAGAYLQLHPEKRPAIVICPASLKHNWAKELSYGLKSPKVQLISGKKQYPLLGEIIIINYDIVDAWLPVLLAFNAQVIILDECHYLKNARAKRSKAVQKLANIPHKILLSGTPIVNRPIEFYYAIRFVSPTLFPNKWIFAKRYCGAKHNGFGWDFNGATNSKELHEILINSIMIRRKKMDVLKDLPDKIYSSFPLEITNKKMYASAENDLFSYIKKRKGYESAVKASNAETLVQIETLKHVAVMGKINACIEWIQDFIESDEKLVVFASHKRVINLLQEKFKHLCVKIDGSVSLSARKKAVEEFQTNPRVRLFIGNIQAAGVGITLTASSNVAFLELPWTPGELVQAEDRCHRIGQKNAVNIYYLLAKNTIEEDIAALLDDKRKVLDNVLEGSDTDETSLLTALLNKYK